MEFREACKETVYGALREADFISLAAFTLLLLVVCEDVVECSKVAAFWL